MLKGQWRRTYSNQYNNLRGVLRAGNCQFAGEKDNHKSFEETDNRKVDKTMECLEKVKTTKTK